MAADKKSALRAVLQKTCSSAGPDFDVDATLEFCLCVIGDDPTADAIAPMLSLTLGDENLALRVAKAAVAVWVKPEQLSSVLANWDGESSADTSAVGPPSANFATQRHSDDRTLTSQPEPVASVADAIVDLPKHPLTGAKQAKPFGSKLSQAERRKLDKQQSPNVAREPPLEHLLRPVPAADRPDIYCVDSVRVCRHFLAGGCFRSDCAYSHDVSGLPCRFWPTLAGCDTGDACPFLHAVEGVGPGTVDIREISGDAGRQRKQRGDSNTSDAVTGGSAVVVDEDGDGASDAGEELRAPPRTLGGAAGLASPPPSARAPPSQVTLRFGNAAMTTAKTPGAGGDVPSALEGSLEELDASELDWLLERMAAIDDEEEDETDVDASANDATALSMNAADRALFPSLPTSLGNTAHISSPTRLSVPAPNAGPRSLGALLPASLLQSSGATTGAVSSAAWVPSGSASSPEGYPADTSATRLALAVLQRAFPTIRGEHVREAYFSDVRGRDIKAAARSLSKEFGVPPVPGVLVSAPPASTAAHKPSAGALRHGSGGVSRTNDLAARRVAQSLERVSTGEAVSSLYLSMRSEAEALAKSRNLAYHRATRAYLSGDGADAARFGRQGRELDEKMRAAHARAAAEIFSARNAGGGGASSSSRRSGTGDGLTLPPPASVDVSGTGVPSPLQVHVFDMHGLHPSEAGEVAEGLVSRLTSVVGAAAMSGVTRSGDGCVWLAFLTGTRHHSQRLGKGGGSIHDALLGSLSGPHASQCEVFDPPSGFKSPGSPTGHSPSGVVVVRCVAT